MCALKEVVLLIVVLGRGHCGIGAMCDSRHPSSAIAEVINLHLHQLAECSLVIDRHLLF